MPAKQLQLLALLGLAAVTSAWLPVVDKSLTSVHGKNLFVTNATEINETVSVAGRHKFKRWLPGTLPIRGVNLGALFIVEPWMAGTEWSDMGCGAYQSEFDCVSGIGQDAANTAFQNHWNTWITQDDITEMVNYGLNTIRIPVGYWMMESIVDSSEHFPQGGIGYLEQVCGWASDAGMYIIIDLHGAPGAQVAENADTGQYASTPGFYDDYNFQRALNFLGWIANLIHTTNTFRNVGMLEIVNEPVQNADSVGDLTSSYYPNAFTTIRNVETSLGLTDNNYLHIQMMDTAWGSGDPHEYLTDDYFAAYDDHRYIKYDTSVTVSHDAYISSSCSYDPDGNWPEIVGEFSLSPPTDVQDTSDWSTDTQQAFYTSWFEAQVYGYEKADGWIFWAWKAQLDDYRWSYKDAVTAGVIPTDLADISNPC